MGEGFGVVGVDGEECVLFVGFVGKGEEVFWGGRGGGKGVKFEE